MKRLEDCHLYTFVDTGYLRGRDPLSKRLSFESPDLSKAEIAARNIAGLNHIWIYDQHFHWLVLLLPQFVDKARNGGDHKGARSTGSDNDESKGVVFDRHYNGCLRETKIDILHNII